MKRKYEGFSLIELIIVLLILSIIATIAIPNLLSARRAANESSAISSLRILHSAQVTYYLTVGAGNYAGSISTTGNTNGLATLANVSLIDSATLGSGTKSGYYFVGSREAATPTTLATFFFSCMPVTISGMAKTGSHDFGIMTDGVIRYTWGTTTQLDKTEVSTIAVLDN